VATVLFLCEWTMDSLDRSGWQEYGADLHEWHAFGDRRQIEASRR
jgi:hypothetical protein